jgi:ferritin-like metal-binding protein YciE
MDTLRELFEDTLGDIYYAEKQITKALPKMAKKTSSEDLSAAFETHLEETQGQIERLEQVFEFIGKPTKAKKCEAIEGIIKEAEELMKEATNDNVRDAAMLAAAQAVEHYEISRYGTLKAWALKLGLDDVVELLDETLQQEKATDEKLSELAESEINDEADEAGETDEADEEAETPRKAPRKTGKTKAA